MFFFGNGISKFSAEARPPMAEARPPVAGWLDPDFLEERWEDSECGLCYGIMRVKPASGCPEGHTFCWACFIQALDEKKECPACRCPVAGEHELVRNRPLEGMISQLPLRCKHGEGEEGGETAAKHAKLEPAASMTVAVIRKQLRQRELGIGGKKPELVARLEADRKKGAGCGWKGTVGGLAARTWGTAGGRR